MKTENSWESPDTELFGARLLRLAGSTVEPLAVRQLLPLHELLQTVVNITHGLLLPLLRLPHGPAVGRGNVDGKIKEGIVGLAGLAAGETGDARLEGPTEDGCHHRVGLRPQHSHLVVHTGQQMEQLRVKSDNNLASVLIPLELYNSHLSSMYLKNS